MYNFTDDSDEEFLPMHGAAMSESVLSGTSMDDSVSSTVSSISSASKSGSMAASPSRRYLQLPCRIIFSILNTITVKVNIYYQAYQGSWIFITFLHNNVL
jgi:hypothetical protein